MESYRRMFYVKQKRRHAVEIESNGGIISLIGFVIAICALNEVHETVVCGPNRGSNKAQQASVGMHHC